MSSLNIAFEINQSSQLLFNLTFDIKKKLKMEKFEYPKIWIPKDLSTQWLSDKKDFNKLDHKYASLLCILWHMFLQEGTG